MADPNPNQILSALRLANSKWLGYRYIIYSIPHSISLAALQLGFLPSAGVSEIVFPKSTVGLRRIPSLSTVDRYIPRHISYGNLILRAPTIRQTSLWDRFKLQERALKDPSLYKDVLETIVIGEFETNTIVDLTPIAVWAARGAQAISFSAVSANAQGGHGSIPLEELVMQVDNLVRLTDWIGS